MLAFSQTAQLLTVLLVHVEGPEDADTTRHLDAGIADTFAAFGGQRAGSQGTRHWAVFETGDDALNAAVAVLSRTAGELTTTLRVAVHTGDVRAHRDRVTGEAINTAARLADLAEANTILLSEAVSLGLHEESRQLLRPRDRIRLAPGRSELRLFEAIWRPEELNHTTIAPRMIEAGYLRNLNWSRLRLTVADHSLDVRPPTTPLAIGRGHRCEVRVEAAAASRVHARIDHRQGKFILVDQSTNGTHLRRSDGSEAVLRNEACVLTGSGCFALGEPAEAGLEWLIAYAAS